MGILDFVFNFEQDQNRIDPMLEGLKIAGILHKIETIKL
jgi:hypothetical protein